MIAKLPPNIYSPDQLGTIAWELDKVISSLRKDTIRRSVVKGQGEGTVSIEVSPLLDSLLKSSNISRRDLSKLEQLLGEIKNYRDDAPTIHVILAAFASNSIKSQLVEWMRREISPQILCTFSVRSDIGGGAIIRTNSKQFDFSFKSKLIDNRYRIGELFADVR